MRGLTLRQLRALVVVARRGRIAAAAAELGLTPPAVTLQLQQLERETGFVLFDRAASGFRPTEAGQIVLDTAAQVADLLTACDERLAELRGVEGGRICVGAVSTAKYFTPALIAAFARAHPGIGMQIRVGNRNEIIERLRTFEIDLAIMGRPPSGMAVESSRIGPHPLVIVAPPDHRLAGRRRLWKTDLYGEAFLIREDGSGTRLAMEDYLAGAPMEAVEIGMELGSNETIKQAVMAGLGIAFISGHTVATEIETGRLALLDVEGLPIMREWFIVRRAEKALTPAVRAFADFVVSEGASYLPPLPSPTGR